MREVIDTYKVYKYEELSEDAKQKACEWFTDSYQYDDWWEFVLDNWKRNLFDVGFKNAEINFSRMFCQGEGASFTADIDFDRLVSHYLYCKNPDYKTANRLRCLAGLVDIGFIGVEVYSLSSSYDHEYTKILRFNSYYAADPVWVSEVIADLEEYRADLCKEIMSDLHSEYKWLTSREHVEEAIEINEYEFYEDGRIY